MISLINVITVDLVNQHRLLDLLARATDELVGREPDFVSSTLHRGLDGTKGDDVCAVAQFGGL